MTRLAAAIVAIVLVVGSTSTGAQTDYYPPWLCDLIPFFCSR